MIQYFVVMLFSLVKGKYTRVEERYRRVKGTDTQGEGKDIRVKHMLPLALHSLVMGIAGSIYLGVGSCPA